LRLKREAAEKAFEVSKDKDETIKSLEELRFLALSTKDLSEDDAYWIERKKAQIKAKLRAEMPMEPNNEDDSDEQFFLIEFECFIFKLKPEEFWSHFMGAMYIATTMRWNEPDGEGAPRYKGNTLANEPVARGLQTTVIINYAVFAMISCMNMTVMANDGMIALVGLHMVALATQRPVVPFVVLAGIHKEEALRIAENATLSHTQKTKINVPKYSAMMTPIVVILERRLASTSRKPDTPHEIWFHNEYMGHIKAANFKTPTSSAAALGDIWRPFYSISASLASYKMKSSISLGEVAHQQLLKFQVFFSF
nr:serine/threonine-protein kinase SMG1-like [Tanacetum cinerariifolium]